MTDQTKTIDRIRKLLALANDKGATEAEAATAMRIAQQLMMEANLSAATIEASGHRAEGRARNNVENKAPYKWMRDLMATLCRINMVSYAETWNRLNHTNQFTGYDLIGRESNVAAVTAMYEYLLGAIDRITKADMGEGANTLNKEGHSFRLGCAQRLMDRVTDEHRRQVEEQARAAREANAASRHPASSGNALVIVMHDMEKDEEMLNRDMRCGFAPGTTKHEKMEQEARHAAATARREARIAEFKAQGANDQEAWRMHIYDCTLEFARKMLADEAIADAKAAKKLDKPETEAQAAKRRELEQRESNRYWERQRREASKIDQSAYRRGANAAESISFNKQAGHESKTRIG